MSRLIAFLTSLMVTGLTYAVEVPADAPLPESNYLGIVVFFILLIGSCAWFIALLVRNERKAKQEKGE